MNFSYILPVITILFSSLLVVSTSYANSADIEIVAGDFGKVSSDLAIVCVYKARCILIDRSGSEVSSLKGYEYSSLDIRDANEGLIPYYSKGKNKWGFINKDGKQVIAPKYELVGSFSEGLASVNINHKWGYIDRTGKLAIAPKFDYVSDFQDGLSSFEAFDQNHKHGFIDKNGNVVIAPQFDATMFFHEGLAWVKIHGKWGAIDKTGKIVNSPQYDCPMFEETGTILIGCQTYYADTNGKKLNLPEYILSYGFHEGLVALRVAMEDGSVKTEFFDRNGILFLEPFEEGYGFHEGLAAVKLKGEWGYINKGGGWEISPEILTKTMQPYVYQAELNKKNEVIIFQKSIIEGTETNCGPVLEIKNKLVKVAVAVANYGNEHWIRRDALYPNGYECRFINGEYQTPE
jgi:hypothetical protein